MAPPAGDDDDHGATVVQQVPLPPDLAAALTEAPVWPGRQLGRLLLAGGARLPLLLALGIALSAVGVVVEALLFRAFFDGGWSHGLTTQRLAALGALVSLVLVLLLLEVPIVSGLLQLGRSLETRLRMTVLERIPRFDDRYFQSRPTSDMAERSHSLHRIRILPALGGRLLRAVCELAATMMALVWLDPSGAGAVVLTGVSTLGFALVVQPLLAERDLRVRTHAGAMSRFYLDALLGLVAVRAHAAERSLRREHESLLVEWVRAGRSFLRIAVGAETGQMLLGFACTAWLFLAYLERSPHPAGALLLLYWAMNLPLLGNEIAALTRQYPQQRNLMLRLLEWLGVNLDPVPQAAVPATPGRQPVSITMKAVTVRAAGHDILEGVDLAVPAGSHLAIVGASGSGKSSLVGLLLGWHRPAFGQLLVDGQPLEGAHLQELRRDTAWVDPAVQLWNRTLHGNLTYGGQGEGVGRALAGADVGGVLEQLPEGLQSMLGEGGGLLSGGEGQRVRFGRALLRGPARLVVLDEPFRGLDREHRRLMLARARERWQGVTLLCVTHDLAETAAFPRVLVVDGGRIVEDGAPADLAAQPGSRYRALLDAERALHRDVWANPLWRRLRFDKGGLVETGKAQ